MAIGADRTDRLYQPADQLVGELLLSACPVETELDRTGSVKGTSYRRDMPVQPSASPDDMTVSVQTTDGQEVVSRQGEVSGDTASWQTTLDRTRALTVKRWRSRAGALVARLS